MNILTPIAGDDFYCKEGSFEDQCNGCLNETDFTDIEAILKCCDTRRNGGHADILLDWLLTEILSIVSENILPGQVLTNREHLAIIGYRYTHNWYKKIRLVRLQENKHCSFAYIILTKLVWVDCLLVMQHGKDQK